MHIYMLLFDMLFMVVLNVHWRNGFALCDDISNFIISRLVTDSPISHHYMLWMIVWLGSNYYTIKADKFSTVQLDFITELMELHVNL